MRKGQVFSLIAILLVVPVLLFLSFSLRSTQTSASQQIEKIIADQEGHLAQNMERDFIRALEITGKRAVLASLNYVLQNGLYLTNSIDSLVELMDNGTLGGNISVIMIDNTMNDWINKVLSVESGFQNNLSYTDLQIQNYDAFNINISTKVIINITDNLNISEINRIEKKDVIVGIESFEDPIFIIGTLGLSGRSVLRYNYPYTAKKIGIGTGNGYCSGNVTFDNTTPDINKILITHNASGVNGYAGVVSDTNDAPSISCYLTGISNIIDLTNQTIIESNYTTLHIDNSTQALWSVPMIDNLDKYYYFENSTNGPNYLQRLEGDLTSSSDGMETFVLQEAGAPDKPSQSRIAYQFFSNNTINGVGVRGFPPYFKIDPGQAGKYNLTDFLI